MKMPSYSYLLEFLKQTNKQKQTVLAFKRWIISGKSSGIKDYKNCGSCITLENNDVITWSFILIIWKQGYN